MRLMSILVGKTLFVVQIALCNRHISNGSGNGRYSRAGMLTC
jgi:hypothetical protein